MDDAQELRGRVLDVIHGPAVSLLLLGLLALPWRQPYREAGEIANQPNGENLSPINSYP
jgi:hypothetical protein